MNGSESSVLRVSTPGRICLFGEHQDYLLLPVISCAISLRIGIEGKRRDDPVLSITMPDIGKHDQFRIDGDCTYVDERDYVRSVVNILRRRGLSFSGGCDCIVRGTIPINAGTSSSSALVVSWVNFLSRLSDQQLILPPREIGHLAYNAEVLEFGEPGGMMDQYTTALGGVLWIGFHPGVRIEPLNPFLKSFVLGDSRAPKNTKAILTGVKNRVLRILAGLKTGGEQFSIFTADADSVAELSHSVPDEDDRSLLSGTIRNRDITAEARKVLASLPLDEQKLGQLLTEHQAVLRDVLGISTPKIDRMIDAAIDAGAFGAKINGSGGGGCMFAYAPDSPEKVAEAVERAGGKAYIVSVAYGTTVD